MAKDLEDNAGDSVLHLKSRLCLRRGSLSENDERGEASLTANETVPRESEAGHMDARITRGHPSACCSACG